MNMKDFEKFKLGDIIIIHCHFGVRSVGIFKSVEEINQTLYCYCVSYKDMKDQVYFSHGERFCSFSIDAITAVEYASDCEIKTLYNKIISQYEKENCDLYDYFTDSTYFELKDWFAYNCGLVNGEDDYKDPQFVYAFVEHAWKVLCEKTNNMEEKNTETKMVNLDDVCKWLDEHITDYQSDMMGFVAYEQIFDIIKDLRKTFK